MECPAKITFGKWNLYFVLINTPWNWLNMAPEKELHKNLSDPDCWSKDVIHPYWIKKVHCNFILN